MKLKLSIFLIFFLVYFQAFSQTKSVYEEKVAALTKAGQPEKVIPYLAQEVQKSPKDEMLLRLIGYQYLQRNNLEMGEKYYRQALVLNPECARCYVNIAKIYAQKNQFSAALTSVEKAIVLVPKDATIISERAQIKENSGDTFGALDDYNKAVDLEPGNGSVYFKRGVFNQNNNYISLALSDFNKAISLDSNNYEPYFYRSRLKLESNDLNSALTDINKAIVLNEQNYGLYNYRGTIYSRQNLHQKALAEHSLAIKLNPNAFISYFYRAEVFHALENMDASCADYQQAKLMALKETGVNPALLENLENNIQDFCNTQNASYYYQRGVAFYNLKQYEKALAIYDAGLQKFPNNAMILSFKGNAYLALKDYQNAGKNYENALKYKENLMVEIKKNHRFKNASNQEIQTYYNASIAAICFENAQCKIYNQQWDEALIAMNEAIKLAPEFTDFKKERYFNRRGELYLAQEKFNLALADFNHSIQVNKNYAEAFVNRAIVKVGIIQKVKKKTTVISTKLPNQPFQINLALKSKTNSQKVEQDLISALQDSNMSIKLNGNIGFSYYIRAQIKYFLNQPDYCLDLIKAKQMGIEVEKSLFPDCDAN